MNCCPLEGTDRYFSKNSAKFEKRFRRGGLDSAQRLILKGLSKAGVRGKSILDIGCGVGNLHLTLLQQGAAAAIGIDISEGMIGRARALADSLNVKDRVHYLRGDFVELAEDVSSCDIVMLDKVVCCYPDVVGLIAASTSKSNQIYALSYPRESFLVSVAFGVLALAGRLFHRSFHPYYHRPATILGTIATAGLSEVYAAATWIWQVRIFRKDV